MQVIALSAINKDVVPYQRH